MYKEFDTGGNLWGLPEYKVFPYPVSYLQDKGFSLWTFLNTKRERFRQLLIRGVRKAEAKEEHSNNNSAAIKEEDLSACSEHSITISLSPSIGLRPPPRWRMVTSG